MNDLNINISTINSTVNNCTFEKNNGFDSSSCTTTTTSSMNTSQEFSPTTFLSKSSIIDQTTSTNHLESLTGGSCGLLGGGTTTTTNGISVCNSSNGSNSSSPTRMNELQRELSYKSMEILKKDDEIRHLKNSIDILNQQYTQELSFCCHYSDMLTRLQKEIQTLKIQHLSKEEQYKKQLLDLQQKLYTVLTK